MATRNKRNNLSKRKNKISKKIIKNKKVRKSVKRIIKKGGRGGIPTLTEFYFEKNEIKPCQYPIMLNDCNKCISEEEKKTCQNKLIENKNNDNDIDTTTITTKKNPIKYDEKTYNEHIKDINEKIEYYTKNKNDNELNMLNEIKTYFEKIHKPEVLSDDEITKITDMGSDYRDYIDYLLLNRPIK
jgi:hypothetical protein